MLKFNSSYRPEYDDDGNLVYFIINVKEAFGVSLRYPGMITAIRKAKTASKRNVPIKTGLLRSSYKMKRLNKDTIRLYFNPSTLGKVYYAKYLVEKPKTRLWLQMVMNSFMINLIGSVRKINKKNEKSQLTALSLIVALELLTKMEEELNRLNEDTTKNGRWK